ncbi:MAG: sugar nucleotide-binding protein [Gemmataceae bacterium]
MRTLILGGTGTLGSAVASACDRRQLPHLTTSYRGASESAPLDVRDADAVRELIADYQPEATVFAAPLDESAGVGNVAKVVADVGGALVLFSSPEVFSADRRAFREDDAVQPTGDRGEAFAAAERLVRDTLPERHLIVRTCDVFDAARFGHVGRIVHALSRFDPVASHPRRTVIPTFAPDVAEVALDLLRHGHTGTFHAVGPERHTPFTFARLVAHLFGYDADLVVADELAGEGTPTRPFLDRTRLKTLLGANALRRPADALRAVRAALTEGSRLRVAA